MPRNWKIEMTLLSRGNYWKNNEDWNNFLRSMIRNHEQWESILLRPWLTEQLWRTYVPHQALITSSSIGKPSREIGMPRNTRENMSILGNVFDCQQARRDPEELHNDSRNLTTPSGIDDDVEDSEKRRNWEQWERRAIAINTFTLLFSKSEEKKSRRQNKSHVYDYTCFGYSDLYSSGMTIPSYLTSGMHLQNSLTKRNFKAGSWISKLKFAQKRRISR